MRYKRDIIRGPYTRRQFSPEVRKHYVTGRRKPILFIRSYFDNFMGFGKNWKTYEI